MNECHRVKKQTYATQPQIHTASEKGHKSHFDHHVRRTERNDDGWRLPRFNLLWCDE